MIPVMGIEKYKQKIQEFANDIEDKLKMDSDEIQALSNQEFKNLLKHGYFARKKYKTYQTEPTQLQIDTLNIHYKRDRMVQTERPLYNITLKFYNVDHKTEKRYYPTHIRKNKRGRLIDVKTGRFVTIRK